MFLPEVVQVIPHDDYTVEVLFQDGKTTIYDAKPLLEKGRFTVLKDKNIFLSCCTVMNHTLAWDIEGKRNPYDCLDIDPDILYQNITKDN